MEFPIVSFIGDFYIQNGKWVVDPKATNPGLKDLRKVLENVYRVLLTRSRKGMLLYFPMDPKDPKDWKLKETYEWFLSMMSLKSNDK